MPLQLISRDDPGYETSRLGWNLVGNREPEAVCVAGTAADVVAAIEYAREHGLRVAAQSTGHGAGALPSLDGTILLKTRLGDGDVEVNLSQGTVSFAAGTTWGQVVDETTAVGQTVMHGSSPTVGTTGYLLGGGLSFYARARGFAANHVTRIELVTGDGEVRTASNDENPDLFWGLRGGGGLFGVVTEIEIGTLAVAQVFAGTSFWPAADGPAILDGWRSWARQAPESVTSTFRILRLPPMDEVPEPIRGVPVACVTGVALDPEAGADLAATLEAHGPPLLGGWGMQPSSAVGTLHGDPEDPLPAIGDSLVLEEITDDTAASFFEAAGPGSDSSLVVAELRHLGGALARPAGDSGVLSHLDGQFMLFGTGLAEPGSAAKTSEDLDRLLESMRAGAAHYRFSTFADRGCPMSDCFPAADVEALTELSRTYDPDGLFVVPQPLD